MNGFVIKNKNGYYVYDFNTNNYIEKSCYGIVDDLSLMDYDVVCFSNKEQASDFIKKNSLENAEVECIDCDPDNFISIMSCFYLKHLKENNEYYDVIWPTFMKKFDNEENIAEKVLKETCYDIVKKRIKE